MSFDIGSAIAGGLSLGSTYLQNRMASLEASKNRRFQASMANTAHVREVADLRAAGLNPILSATGGSGASSPAGSVAPVVDMAGPAIASALQVMRTLADTSKTQADTELVKAQRITELNRPELVTNQANSARTLSNLQFEQSENQKTMNRFLKAQGVGEEIRNKILNQDLVSARAAAKRAVTEGDIDDSIYGKVLRYLDRLQNYVPLLRQPRNVYVPSQRR